MTKLEAELAERGNSCRDGWHYFEDGLPACKCGRLTDARLLEQARDWIEEEETASLVRSDAIWRFQLLKNMDAALAAGEGTAPSEGQA